MAKLLYTMGEVTEMFDVNASLIRYWESKFDCIKPQKNKKGNRLFTPSDIENFKLIYHLVKEKGMTLEGANRTMKRRGVKVKQEISILERLQHIRAMLLEVRESLGDNTPAEYEAPIEAMEELISDVETQAQAEVVSGVTTKEEPIEVVEAPKDDVVEETPRRRGRPRKVVEQSDAEEMPQSVTRRKPKAKRAEEHKELFPFYEQSLF